MTRNPRHSARPRLEQLEDRRLMAGNILLDATGLVAIHGTAAADHARVWLEGGAVVVRLTDAATGAVTDQASFDPAQVQSLLFLGHDGDDRFVNDLAVRCTAYGGNGNDYLEGGSGQDFLCGDAGDDTLVGFTGKDRVCGGDGDDYLFGMGGKDRLYGQAGTDALFGGTSRDVLRGKGDHLDGRGDGPLGQRAAADSQKLQAYLNPPAVSAPAASDIEAAIVAFTNQERQRAGLAPLAVNAQLTAAARHHAANMARLDRMAHTLSGADLPDLDSRLNHYGYRYLLAGENVAWNYPSAQAAVAAWMNSPGHRANILSPNYTEIGVAVAYNSRGEPYYCQVFGTLP